MLNTSNSIFIPQMYSLFSLIAASSVLCQICPPPVTITVTAAAGSAPSAATPNSASSAASVAAAPAASSSGGTGAVPDIGFPAGDPNATVDRLGADGKTNVPGRCPPTQAELDAHLLSIHPETFAVPAPALDLDSRIQRYEQTLSGLQDLKCPASSTTLKGRLLQLTALRSLSKAEADAKLAGLGLNDVPL